MNQSIYETAVQILQTPCYLFYPERLKKTVQTFQNALQTEYAFYADELEYGPGFQIAYFEHQPDQTNEDLSLLSEAITAMTFHGKITLEMGRALTAYAGDYLTQVKDVKQNTNTAYAIVDGGMHQINYDGQIRGIYQPKVQIFHRKSLNKRREYCDWTICGSLCTANDVLIQKLPQTSIAIGDLMVFQNAGAYAVTEGMQIFLSHTLPAIALYDKKTDFVILRKKRETYPINMPENLINEREEE